MTSAPTLLTKTWRRRLDTGGSTLRKMLHSSAFVVCAIVALNTVWGWIADEPLDIDGPARAAINRTDYIGGYAVTCVRLLLTVTEAQRAALNTCWAPDELRALPTTPPVVVDSTTIAKIVRIAAHEPLGASHRSAGARGAPLG